MKRLIILIASLASISSIEAAVSNAPENARYAFIQSEVGAIPTFLLNRYDGSLYRMMQTKEGSLFYRRVESGRLRKYTTPTYIFYTAAFGAINSFVVDTNSGATWRLEAKGTQDGPDILTLIDSSEVGDKK